MKKISLRATALAVAALAAGQAWATNGMLMEGYGPIALSMGGASQAYDNGTAAMINNVATLQLGENGTRADMALGILGPSVASSMTGMPTAKSGGTSYVMPAFGWVRKNDLYSYGVGVFGQGGMGTEYSNSSFMGAGTGDARSELGVGRVIFPVSMKVNDRLNVGASLDFTWANLDMKMLASPQQFAGMYEFANNGNSLPGMYAGNYARLDFSNSNDFTGQAKGSGWTGKFGATFKATEDLNLGVSYQMKTRLSDLTTGANGAQFTLIAADGPQGAPGTAMPAMNGKIIVRNFQMPSVLAAGASWQASPVLNLVADVKRIGWSSVMKSFNMAFDMGGGQVMNFGMPQNWNDQTVVSLGGSYKVNDALKVRAGYSHSTNPIPDAMVNPLFPAIVKDHFMAGFGYQLSKNMTMDAAISHAPKVTVVNAADPSMPVTITHSQTNYQLMLSYRY